MNGILGALLMTLIAGAATGLGGALVLFKKKLSSNFLAGALGVSAGVMIFISLAELFPEAQGAILQSGVPHGKALVLIAFFVGMGIITLIDFTVPEYENPHEASGLSLDERTPAVGFMEDPGNAGVLKRLGIMSALAIAIHNFPEGMATFIGALNDLRWELESPLQSQFTTFLKVYPWPYLYIMLQEARARPFFGPAFPDSANLWEQLSAMG